VNLGDFDAEVIANDDNFSLGNQTAIYQQVYRFAGQTL
jgi:hypothetical protein